MLQLVNYLCKETEAFKNKDSFSKFLLQKATQLNIASSDSANLALVVQELCNYKHEKTGDSLINYAARCGNLRLLKFLFDDFESIPGTRGHRPKLFNSTNNDGKNGLHEACQNGHFECVKFLVEKAQLPVDSLRKGDWTPLMLACTGDNLEMVKYLIEKKANILQKNKDGWNAFQIAIREGHHQIIDFMLDLDPELAVNIRTKNGRTPFHTACLHGHLDVLKILIDKSAQYLANQSATKEDTMTVKTLLNSRDACGTTPFMDAVLGDQTRIVDYLLKESRADRFQISLLDRDAVGNTCIHLAAQSGSIECLKYLFDVVFDQIRTETPGDLIEVFSSTVNKLGMTALHSASKNGREAAMEFILERLFIEAKSKSQFNDSIMRKDKNGNCVIDICQSSNNKSCLRVLNKFLNN